MYVYMKRNLLKDSSNLYQASTVTIMSESPTHIHMCTYMYIYTYIYIHICPTHMKMDH